jgi:predicted PurR-regulated permease PerM
MVAVAQATYESLASLTAERLEGYRVKIEGWVNRGAAALGYKHEESAWTRLQRMIGGSGFSAQELVKHLQSAAGSFFDFLSFGLIVVIYLVFLLAEKITFPQRMRLAFGEQRAGALMQLVASINDAIVNYVAVKAWISLVTGALSLAVFLVFGIEFAFLWGMLVFLLNFIPYLGSLVALTPPILLAFLQLELWQAGLVLALLIAIQLFTGQFLEPKLAGRKLNLSPLLIVLALAFWAYLWGIVGMILAVPLTVVLKIILDHIPETRPVGTLMSNV